MKIITWPHGLIQFALLGLRSCSTWWLLAACCAELEPALLSTLMFADRAEAHTEGLCFISTREMNTLPSPAGPFLTHHSVLSLPLTSPAFLSENQAGQRDHLGGLDFILLKEGSSLNSEYVAQGFIQKSAGNLWTTCISGWLHSPWCGSSLTSCSDFG